MKLFVNSKNIICSNKKVMELLLLGKKIGNLLWPDDAYIYFDEELDEIVTPHHGVITNILLNPENKGDKEKKQHNYYIYDR